MTSYAVVTPSRGLIHSRTVEAVMDEIAATRATCRGWVVSHDLPIPDCHETVVEAGLATGADALWLVEEDVVPPPGALEALLDLLADGAAVAGIDYPVATDWGCAVRDAAGAVLWVGTGCTAIAASWLARVERPWFRTDRRWIRDGAGWRDVPASPDDRDRFGQQDIALCAAIRTLGGRIEVVPETTAAHAWVAAMGRPGSNVGWHDVRLRTVIREQYPGETR